MRNIVRALLWVLALGFWASVSFAQNAGSDGVDEMRGENVLLTTKSDLSTPALSPDDVREEALEVVYDGKDFDLSPEEKDVFESKKRKFLDRFAKTLATFRMKQAWIDKASKEIEKKFIENAPLIARSNTIGGTVSFTVNGGLALPKKIVEGLQKTPIGRFLPSNGGFYYVLGIGFGLVRQTDPDGKSRMVLESYVDFERMIRTLTGIAEVGAAGNYGVVYESRGQIHRTTETLVQYGGATGSFRHGEKMFGWSATSGFSFPPLIGAFLVFTDQSSRYYLFRVSNKGLEIPLIGALKDFYKRVRRQTAVLAGAPVCGKLFTAN